MERSLPLVPLEFLVELCLLLSYVLGTIAHEAGHGIAGWLAGLDVRTISVGTGPAVLRHRIGRLLLVMHAIPVSGFASIALRPGMSRLRYAAMIAGGPAVNILLLAVLVLLDRVSPYYDVLLVPAGAAQAILLLLTLPPYRSRSRGAWRPSDGLQLWTQLARRPPDLFAAQYAAIIGLVYPAGTPLPSASAAAPELLFQTSRVDRWSDPCAAREASSAILGLLTGDRLNIAERALALDFLASSQILFAASDAPIATLDAWSAEACALAPGPPTSITRGGVFATTGRGSEADALLLPLAGGTATPVHAFLCDLFLAMAAAAQGHTAAAQARLAAARNATRARTPQRGILKAILARAERSPPLAPTPHAAITRA